MIGLFENVGIAILNLIVGVIGLRNKFYLSVLNLVIAFTITLDILEKIV